MKEISGQLDAKGMSFGVVISRFNSIFTTQLLKGMQDCLERHGASSDAITVAWVPGANELPLVAQSLAASGKFDAVIALGCVIRGATPHADLINGQVSRSLAKISLDAKIPVTSGLVCADNLDQAIERSGSKAGNKGWDAAQAAVEMASVMKAVKSAMK